LPFIFDRRYAVVFLLGPGGLADVDGVDAFWIRPDEEPGIPSASPNLALATR